MASLESQKKTITAILNEALARLVRAVELKKASTRPAQAVNAILSDIERDNCLHLAQLLKGEPVSNVVTELHEIWLAEALTKARAAIAAITPANVRNTRKAGQTTSAIFEAHIDAAEKEFKNGLAGVFTCLAERFRAQDSYTPEGVAELAQIKILASKVVRRLKIFRSRFWSMLSSGWVLLLVLMITIASVPVFYSYHVYAQSGARTLLAARPAVEQQAHHDLAALAETARQPQTGMFDKTVSIVSGIDALIDKTSKILAAIVAAWACVRAWLKR